MGSQRNSGFLRMGERTCRAAVRLRRMRSPFPLENTTLPGTSRLFKEAKAFARSIHFLRYIFGVAAWDHIHELGGWGEKKEKVAQKM